ncbi:hypothetical protein ACOMHN_007149 [Nucella lapillus]
MKTLLCVSLLLLGIGTVTMARTFVPDRCRKYFVMEEIRYPQCKIDTPRKVPSRCLELFRLQCWSQGKKHRKLNR